MIKVKRVYEKPLITDGKRVLVDRLWPRGVRTNTPNVDIWLRDVAPSTELRKWFNHNPGRWKTFKIRYLKELKNNKALEKLIDIINTNDPVTLVYATRDQEHNNALILFAYLSRKLRLSR